MRYEELGNINIELGYSQMGYFMACEMARPQMPVAWVGEEAGRVYQVTKLPVVNAFDLAQMLGVVVARMEWANTHDKGLLLRWRNDREINEDLVKIAEIDLWMFEQLMKGAILACAENRNGRMSGDARLHIERLLSGERFPSVRGCLPVSTPFCSHAE
jgi:hypothetical protein